MIDHVLERLTTLFTEGGARFRVVHHPQAGQSSQSVAEIRGTELGQGAKALCCTVKGTGVSFMTNSVDWHGKGPNDEEYAVAMQELNAAYAALEQEDK